MTWDPLIQGLVGLAASAIVAIVGKWFNVKVDEAQRKKLEWALEQGVAYAAEKLRKTPATGAEKQQLAHQTAASLAPKALEKVGDQQARVLLDATYAKMKASLPQPSMFSMSGEDIPVDVVDLEARKTMHPPKRPPKPS